MGKEKKEKKDKKEKKEKKERKEKDHRRERDESADESENERSAPPRTPARSKDKDGKRRPVDVDDIDIEEAPQTDKKRSKETRSRDRSPAEKPRRKKGGDDSDDERQEKPRKKKGKGDSEDDWDVEEGKGRRAPLGRRNSGGQKSGKSSPGSAGLTGGEEDDLGEEEDDFGEEEFEEEEEEESDAEDPEGAFIHPDDLELEEEYYDGEGEITYPGVIRPWEEAIAIAQEEAEDERLYDEDGFKYPFFVSVNQLEHLGFGVQLYLRETKMLTILFFFMSCFATPSIIFNYMVQKAYKVYGDSEEIFAQVSVGTQMIAVEENGVIVTDITYYGYNKDEILTATSLLDVAYTAIFLTAVIGTRAAFAKLVARKKGTKLSIERFSVEVSGLPREVIDVDYAIELKDHFEKLVGDGTVAEVAVSTTNCSMLDTITEKAEAVKMRRQYASIINRSRGAKGHREYDKACAQVNALDEDIEKCMTASELYPSVAYVTFESVAAQIKCLNICGGFIKSALNTDTHFRGRSIATWPAPRPTSVNWQNLHVRKIEQKLRGYSTHVISVAWIGITFLVLTYADAFSEDRPPVVDFVNTAKAGNLNCTLSFPMEFLNGTRTTAWDNNITKGYRALVKDLTYSNPGFDPPACTDWVRNRIFMGIKPENAEEDDTAVWTPIPTDQNEIRKVRDLYSYYMTLKSELPDAPVEQYVAKAAADAPPEIADSSSALSTIPPPPAPPTEREDILAIYETKTDFFDSYACAAFVCYANYCQKKGRSGWLANSDGVGEFCTNYWMVWIKSSAILIAATMVGFIVERSIASIAGNLADFEKHWTQERNLASLGFKVFLSTIFNMLGTLFITFGHIQGLPRGQGLLSLPFLFGGKFVDFTGSWYAEVGSAFTRTLVFQAVVPFLTELLFMAIWFGYRRLRRSAMVNQEHLKELYANYEFEAPKMYGELHATLFVVMILCPGLPIILWCFFAYLVNLLLFDRFVMLRLAEVPEELDEALAIESLDTIPWATVLHFAVGLWMYGAAGSRYVTGGIHPSEENTPSTYVWGATLADQFDAKKRIYKTAGLPQFCGFVVVIVMLPVYFFARSFSTFIKGLTTRQSRNGFEGMDPSILSIPVLRRIRPAYVLRPEDASVAGSRAGSEMSEFDMTKERKEPPDPGEKIIKLKTAHMQWSGPVSYDMTLDERHAKTFSRASKTGHLTTYEASRFTVFDHGGRVKQIRGWGSPGSLGRGEGEEGEGEEFVEEEEGEGAEPLDYIEEEDEEAAEEEEEEEPEPEKKSKKSKKEKKEKKEKKSKKERK